jgi:hypothetical protein
MQRFFTTILRRINHILYSQRTNLRKKKGKPNWRSIPLYKRLLLFFLLLFLLSKTLFNHERTANYFRTPKHKTFSTKANILHKAKCKVLTHEAQDQVLSHKIDY